MQKIKQLAKANEPFYGDVLARSLLRIGIPKYIAYQMTHKIWQQISNKKKDDKEIGKLTEKMLRKKYPDLIKKYKIWRKIMKKEKPIIILIGGGTGVGTSTLAMRVAWLLEMDTIISTDSVREVIRQFLNNDILPILHVSSYEAGKIVKEVKSSHDRIIYGFISQSKEVLNGINAVVKRAIKESASMVIEGIHVVPGEMDFLQQYNKKAHIIQIMMDVKQKNKHKLHFFSRHVQSVNRNKEKYLKNFKEIRLIRDYLIKQAEKNKITVIQNYNLKTAEKDILNEVYLDYVH